MTVQNAMYVGFQVALVFVLLCAALAGMVQLAFDHPKIFFRRGCCRNIRACDSGSLFWREIT